MTKKHAAIYCRISKDTEGLGLGVERQERECRDLCKARGWPVAEVYVDNDISAYSGKARPGYAAMLAAMERGAFGTVVCWHPDRLTRQPIELEALIDTLESTKTKAVSVQAGEYDLATPSGRMSARIVGAVARGESEHKSARLRSKMDQLAASGNAPAGRPPYGYVREGKTYAINPAEADHLRWMADRILDGASLGAVARESDARKVTTREGRPWNPTTVRAVLINPAAAGLRVHRREVAGVGTWPPILERDTWEAVRAIVADPRRKMTRPNRKHLLTGIAENPAGQKLYGSTVARKPPKVLPDGEDPLRRRSYVTKPNADPWVGIDSVRLETLVVEAVLQRFDQTALSDVEAAPTSTELQDVEAELAELARLRGEGEIDLAEWLAAREPLQRRIAEARDKAGPAPRPAAVLTEPGALRRAWPTMPFADQHAILRSVLRAVVVSPSGKGRWVKTEDRVTLVYR